MNLSKSDVFYVFSRLRRNMMKLRFLFLVPVISILFVAAAVQARSIRDEGIIADEPPQAYAGSDRCAECHAAEYDQWSKTLKARFVRRRKDVGELPGNWKSGPLQGREDESRLVVGLRRKVAFVGSDWRVMGAEYSLAGHSWKRRNGWLGQDYRSRCGMCHLTGCNPYRREFAALGVGCEACHGPGARHVQSEDPDDILLPGRNGRDVLETCRRCHNGRNSHASDLRGFSGKYHQK
ncbi:multiheme c-type cytochrome [Pseudodesulfovibrio sp.]|uniref:multiheme c-type cytochrome n=1 Tax=unclassified Pseudodesulfovibrio TaxID=2661612 RepID=UPI003B0032DD